MVWVVLDNATAVEVQFYVLVLESRPEYSGQIATDLWLIYASSIHWLIFIVDRKLLQSRF